MYKQFHNKLFFTFSYVLNNFANISHIIDVLEFRRGRQQLLGYFLENLKSSKYDRFRIATFWSKQGIEYLKSC
jgi:hypothetical protein